MNFSLNLLSDHDKEWLERKAIAPIVAAIDGLRDAIRSKEETIQAIKAMQERVDKFEQQSQAQKG
jgi:hypothetical protein